MLPAALTFEGFRANLSPLDPRAQAAHPAPGQREIAARLTALLAGSALWNAGAARRVQDPLSLRCVSQVHGAALAVLWNARDHVELELNSAAESPLVGGRRECCPTAISMSPDWPRVRHARHRAGASGDALRPALPEAVLACAFGAAAAADARTGPSIPASRRRRRRWSRCMAPIRHLANPASLDCRSRVGDGRGPRVDGAARRGQDGRDGRALCAAGRDRVARRRAGRRSARLSPRRRWARAPARACRGARARADARRRPPAGARHRDDQCRHRARGAVSVADLLAR